MDNSTIEARVAPGSHQSGDKDPATAGKGAGSSHCYRGSRGCGMSHNNPSYYLILSARFCQHQEVRNTGGGGRATRNHSQRWC